jgi:fatty-acyl-CoA synthase
MTTASAAGQQTVEKPLGAWLRALSYTSRLADDPSRTLPARLDELAETFGPKPALISPRDALTYQELVARTYQYSRWAMEQGIQPGDTVCLMMPNCAEFVAIWLGITRVGGVVALINTNFKGHALQHSIGIVAPKHIVVGAALAPALLEVMSHLPRTIRICVAGPDVDDTVPLPALRAAELPGTPLASVGSHGITTADRALHIYTSGTTGLPKAANISHYRLLEWSYWFAGMMDTRPEDRMYNCLPMYHSTGGIVAVGAILVRGGTVVIGERFSASQFWSDVTANDCTLFQYIGELCRYLLNSPKHANERNHRLRLCCGNGLREDVWTAFQRRFAVPRILEFYASTEGNVSLYNCEGRPGAIGRLPPFLAARFPVALIRCGDAGEPLRDSVGLCERVKPGEVGEAIGQIAEGQDKRMSAFDGYTDVTASQTKVLRDVFAPGDAWFRTGDLMRRDSSGFFYFVDRAGDTFRWKGENVSTAQVAEVISSCPGVKQAVVYGISIPDTDGKAGMAAVVVSRDFSLRQLWEHTTANLPEFARPLIIRLCTSLPITGTFKPIAAQLAADGYDPGKIDDALYITDPGFGGFVHLTPARYGTIVRGEIRASRPAARSDGVSGVDGENGPGHVPRLLA